MVREPVADPANELPAELASEEIARLAEVPRGAVWLAGIAVSLLLAAWLLIYLAIYLPRGMIG